ncbi:MAG: alpha/beta fold hydrolase [Candidatus Thorarchaeota archaeon]|nr:MAG: alpha/beta fold hydrolase [Candidatus Thorarchaeota archaeon]
MSEFTEQFLDTGELKIHYRVGPDNDPPLVLIPGQGGDWKNYEKVLEPLSGNFQVYAVDVRGHGKSDWATGNYTWDTIGADMVALLEKVVKRRAIVSGNSSGGLIALWLAANRPDLVSGIVMEDPPLFSAEWPRIRDDSFVYRVLTITVEISRVLRESRSTRELAKEFMKIKRPVKGGKIRGMPSILAYYIAFRIRRSQKRNSGEPSLSGRLKTLVDMLYAFDADFSQAFLDGRVYEGLDHADALSRAECPMLLLHANWLRHPEFGLVGAMDDDDAARARKLVPEMQYKRIDSDHVIHSHRPEVFVREVEEFAAQLQ